VNPQNLKMEGLMIKAIFFDIDGTLVSFKTHQIPESAVEALVKLREAGIKLFVASGRHKSEMEHVRRVFEFDGYLSLNGQICFDNKGTVLHKPVFSKEDVAIAVAEAGKKEFPLNFVCEDSQFMNMADETVTKMCNDLELALPPLGDPEKALDMDVYQLIAYLKKDEEDQFLSQLHHVESARWHGDFLDIIPAGGGKHAGIKKVIHHFGIKMTETMAFGDGGNDISMLLAVNVGIAMGNAGEAVKLAADYITADVDDDGVWKALKHFSLI